MSRFLFLLLLIPEILVAQFNIRDTTIRFPMIGPVAGFQLPGGDLSDRFGNNFNVGGTFLYKTRSNWVFGIEGNFLFSDNVRENQILNKYLTPDGFIIDANGQAALVLLSQRGWKFDLKFGKVFNFIGPNPNSGLFTSVGAGILQHKIKIETPGNAVPFLEDEYQKGYDRLTNGFALTEFIGYMHFSNRRLVNFFAGIECTQGFTRNKREVNFDDGSSETSGRTDLLFGLRFGWVIPIYKRTATNYYIN